MRYKYLLILLFLSVIVVLVWAKTSLKQNFSQAKDFPVGALIYLQVADLPQLITLWNESELKEKYLESDNYADFSTSHLGIKLAERFEDLSSETGFLLDLQTVSGLAEKQAAIAVYDIGKLDIVFVAPLNETLFSATIFSQNSGRFAENTLADGTVFYQIEVEVDRKRQKQHIIFTNLKNKFVLATNEKLFRQTVAILTAKQTNKSLYDEPSFKQLTENAASALAAVWVNQAKLNTDYYFKRYWLLSKIDTLQNIRAGFFNLNLNENGVVENRQFLLKEPRTKSEISNREAEELLAKIPVNVPFYRLQKADKKNIGEAVCNTIFDKASMVEKPHKDINHWSYSYYSNNIDERHYSYFDSDFDENVNEPLEAEFVKSESFSTDKIKVFGNPATILTAASPQVPENSPFAGFRKIAVISLKSPNYFLANQFENSIAEALKNRITAAETNFVWETAAGLRKLKIPMLGWEVGYVLKDDKLFVANNFGFLNDFVSTENRQDLIKSGFDDLTVIRLQDHEKNFEQIMQKLAAQNNDFFVGNIGGLLSVIKDVKQIEIRKQSEGLIIREEISAVFKQ